MTNENPTGQYWKQQNNKNLPGISPLFHQNQYAILIHRLLAKQCSMINNSIELTLIVPRKQTSLFQQSRLIVMIFQHYFKTFRGSRSQMFFKIDDLGNFANFLGKHLCWSLFLIKFQAYNFIKKRLQQRCFPKKFAKFVYLFSQNNSGRSFLTLTLMILTTMITICMF